MVLVCSTHQKLPSIEYSISDCPGADSNLAGKDSACDGCPNQRICLLRDKTPVDPGKLQFRKILVM